jgi:hypothetical protein
MGQLALLPGRVILGQRMARLASAGFGRRKTDPGAAARGVLLGLALSSVVWIAIALLVPRLW